jgi:hypothetical protein
MFISKLKRTFYTNPAANQVNQQTVPRSFQNRTFCSWENRAGYFWTAGKKEQGFLIGIGRCGPQTMPCAAGTNREKNA